MVFTRHSVFVLAGLVLFVVAALCSFGIIDGVTLSTDLGLVAAGLACWIAAALPQMLPKQHSGFDEHRNTSRVWPVTAQDGENARRALASFRRDHPELHRWITDGAPTLTEVEHVQRFGAPYRSHRRAQRERSA